MTMRSYDDIEFRPWYLPDTARWLKLSLGARGLVAELLRKLDRHGRIALGEDPAADLAVILRLDEDDTRKALTELLTAGRLVWDPVARLLTDPDLPTRMRLGSAARMAKKRANDAAKAAAATPANDAPSQPVTSVTSGVGVSPSDLPLICSSGSEIRSEDPPRSPRADEGLVHSELPLEPDARAKYETYTANRHLDTTVEDTWLAFVGHFAGQRFGSRDGILGKFQKWLTQQAKMDDVARARRRDEADRAARPMASKFVQPDTPPAPYHAPAGRKGKGKAPDEREPTDEERAETRRLAAQMGNLFAVPKTGTE